MFSAIKSQAATANFMPPVMAQQPYLQPNPLSYSSPAVQLPPSYSSYIAPEEPKIIYHSETPLQAPPAKASVNAPQLSYNPAATVVPVRKSTIAKPSTPKPPPPPPPSKIIHQHYLHKQVGAVKKEKHEKNLFSHLTTNPASKINYPSPLRNILSPKNSLQFSSSLYSYVVKTVISTSPCVKSVLHTRSASSLRSG